MLIQKLRQVGFTIHIVPREVVGNIFLDQISVVVVVVVVKSCRVGRCGKR